MSTDTGDGGDGKDREWTEEWSESDREAAIEVERKCGIALVPDGVDD